MISKEDFYIYAHSIKWFNGKRIQTISTDNMVNYTIDKLWEHYTDLTNGVIESKWFKILDKDNNQIPPFGNDMGD